MNLDGNADTGVSMLMLWCCCGTGRAKGFGGPVAPAERRLDASTDGDGGGSTMPRECCDVLSVEVLRGDEEPAVALPASEASSGICTFSRGLEAPPGVCRLLVRDGGVKALSGIEIMESCLLFKAWLFDRGGWGGELVGLLREMLPTSTECDRLPSDFEGSEAEWKADRCWPKIDEGPSIGVKILPPLRCGSLFTCVSRPRRGGCRIGLLGSGLTSG